MTVSLMRARDLTARVGGRSTFQAASPYYSLHGIPEGSLNAQELVDLSPGTAAQPGRQVGGVFTDGQAAVGLIVATLLMVYLGSRVVVEKR